MSADAREAVVERVVDGDTVVLAGLGKVRLIGVDTPELYGGAECFGREASAYAKRMLGHARVRYLVGREERDRYGRLLAYLWLADGRSFNALLVSRGYAQPLTIPPNDDYADLFVQLARRARESRRGLWSDPACGAGIFRPKVRRYVSITLDRAPPRWSHPAQRRGPKRKERGHEV